MRHADRLFPVLLLVWSMSAVAVAQDTPYRIVRDVVYGRKDGMALTLDVVQPAEPNGAGVLMIRSGGWYSTWRQPESMLTDCRPLLDKGFTVFNVYHGSAPKYAIPDAMSDIRRSVRFIRSRATDFGVDPDRLGAYGRSAGGHMVLLLGTTADDGDPAAEDVVLRESSRIAAVVAVYPPTDIRGWVEHTPAEILKHPHLKPPLTFDPALEADLSPLLHITADDAPALFVHGDQDELVPLSHSQTMHDAMRGIGLATELIVLPGAAHGFSAAQFQESVYPESTRWFETHLLPSPVPAVLSTGDPAE